MRTFLARAGRAQITSSTRHRLQHALLLGHWCRGRASGVCPAGLAAG